MRTSALAGLLLVLTLAAGVLPAYADDGALGRSGETVVPLVDQEIRMADETVVLTLDGMHTVADLTFTFTNDGPARTMLMGFPLEERAPGERGDAELHGFQTWVDGVPVEARRETGGPSSGSSQPEYPAWMTWSVAFAAGQTHVVHNTYWVTNSFWSNGDVRLGYILKTGAAWKGPIGHAVIRVHSDLLPVDPFRVAPADYRWEGNDLVWEWRDFEPRADIEVMWNTRPNAPPEDWEPLMTAAEKGGPAEAAAYLKGYRQATPNSGAPDAIDMNLALWLHQSGDDAGASAIVRRALEARVQHPFVPYLAVLEGLRQPAAVLDWTMNLPLRRWLQDRAGLEGEPPDLPVITFREQPAPTVPWINVRLTDPDDDLVDWGVKVWLEPDEHLTPFVEARYDPSDPGSLEGHNLFLYAPSTLMSDWVWVRAWVLDGRGHRRETPLVKLAVPAGAKDPGLSPSQDQTTRPAQPQTQPAAPAASTLPGSGSQPQGGVDPAPQPQGGPSAALPRWRPNPVTVLSLLAGGTLLVILLRWASRRRRLH